LLFERNGLQHGGFDVPPVRGDEAAAVVRDLIWSADSELLAVVLGPGEQPPGSSDGGERGGGAGDGWRVQVRGWLVSQGCGAHE
jgi:hypothetical protein